MQPKPIAAPHILVVENEAAICEMLIALLEVADYRVTAVEHGRAALAYLEQSDELPALLLLDLAMPVMDGWEFYSHYAAHAAWRSIGLVVMSAGTEGGRVGEVMAGAAFLQKPFQPARLLELIAARLERAAPRS